MSTEEETLARLTGEFLAIESEYRDQLERLRTPIDADALQHVDTQQVHTIIKDLEGDACRLQRMISRTVIECKNAFTTPQREHARAVIASHKRSLARTQELLAHIRELRAGALGCVVPTRLSA
jgi:hypothetical protein